MDVEIHKFPATINFSDKQQYLSYSWAALNYEKSPVFILTSNKDYWILIRQNLFTFSPRFFWLKPFGWWLSSLHAYGSPTGNFEILVNRGEELAQKSGCASFIINDLRDTEDNSLIKILESRGFSRQTWATFLVDLTKNEEELWNAVKKEARKLVNKSKREGVSVRIATTDADFEAYYELLKESRKKLGFATCPYKEVLDLRKHFGSDYTVFLAEYQGKIIAGMGIMHKGGFIREIMAGRDEKYKTLYANDLMKWEIIRWGHEKGFKVYDLRGINPNPAPGSKEEGIYRFKEKWGGKFCEVYTYTKEIFRWKNDIIRFLKRFNK